MASGILFGLTFIAATSNDRAKIRTGIATLIAVAFDFCCMLALLRYTFS